MKTIRLTKKGWGPAYLLNSLSRKKCCLGTYGTACGVSDEVMLNRHMPNEIPKRLRNKFPRWLFSKSRTFQSSQDAEALATANDRYFLKYFDKPNTSRQAEAERKKCAKDKIRRIFAKHKVRVVFERGL
jgi:hypothetical protein